MNKEVQGTRRCEVCDPYASYIIGCGWLLREIELAHVTVGDVEVVIKGDRPWVQLRLPVSKGDTHGTGCVRSLPHDGCDKREPGDIPCFACMALEQKARVLEKWSGKFPDMDDDDLPLCPTVEGKVAAKAQMVSAWRLLKPEDLEDPTGHTARRSGAKHFARRGWVWPAIRFHGRWLSTVVLAYLESAIAETGLGAAFEDDDNAIPSLEERIWKIEAALPKFATRKADPAISAELMKQVAENAAAETVAQMEYDTVTFESGKVHRLASGTTARPALAWRTRCGRKLVTEKNFVLNRAHNGCDTTSNRCMRCFKEEGVGGVL